MKSENEFGKRTLKNKQMLKVEKKLRPLNQTLKRAQKKKSLKLKNLSPQLKKSS
jgi:hypothetical protein